IELLHDHLRPAAQAVVKRGGAVEQHQGETIDRHADDLRDVAAHGGQYQQPDTADKGEYAPGQMCPGIEFFSVVHRGGCSGILSFRSARRKPSWRYWWLLA